MGRTQRHRHRGSRNRSPLGLLATVAVVGGVLVLVPCVNATQVIRGGTRQGLLQDPEVARFGARSEARNSSTEPAQLRGGPGGPGGPGGAAVGGTQNRLARNVPVPPAVPAPPVPQAASGRLVVVPARAPAPVRGRLVRYQVEVEAGLPPGPGQTPGQFAVIVQQVLSDRRSWGRGSAVTFQQVVGGKTDFTIALASPKLTDRYCLESGNNTEGKVSCFARLRNMVMINAIRWADGAAAYGGDLSNYRTYLVNHEVGHRLGYRHTTCPGPSRLAPVMVQQTKGVGACRPNPWPFP